MIKLSQPKDRKYVLTLDYSKAWRIRLNSSYFQGYFFKNHSQMSPLSLPTCFRQNHRQGKATLPQLLAFNFFRFYN